MFTILQNGLDNGAYNLDKVNDFVKEFGVSLSDGRIAALAMANHLPYVHSMYTEKPYRNCLEWR